uniref:Uncharacterized protein n=1 Tax=Anguilla anguilla TaxID=7936 RepID=A0A0E9W1V3_ANGAN
MMSYCYNDSSGVTDVISPLVMFVFFSVKSTL